MQAFQVKKGNRQPQAFTSVSGASLLQKISVIIQRARSAGLHRVAATISMLGMSTVVSAAMVFLTQTLLARQLGPADYGMFASSLATVTMVAPLAAFGVTEFLLKAYGVEGWQATRWRVSTMKVSLFTTMLAILGVVAWAFLVAPADDTRFMLLFLWPVILGVLSVELLGNKSRLEDRFKRMVRWQLTTPTSRLLTALLLTFVPGLTGRFVAVSYGAIALLVFLIALPHLRALYRGELDLKGHGPRPADLDVNQLEAPSVREVWIQAWPYGMFAALYPIFFQVSTILLKYLSSNEHAGLYSIANAVMSAVYLIPTTIYYKFLLAKMHRWAAHDKPKFWFVYHRGNIGMFALGILVGLGMLVLSPWVVPRVFGKEFSGVVNILYVLALCPPIRFLSAAVGTALLTGSHMRFRVYAMAFATIAAVGFNILLIPRFGDIGAAWATVVAEAVLLLGTWLGVRRFKREESRLAAGASAEKTEEGRNAP